MNRELLKRPFTPEQIKGTARMETYSNSRLKIPRETKDFAQFPARHLFGPKAAARYLGICEDSLKKITDLGQLRAFTMNGRRAYRLEDLEAFVESLHEWYDSQGEESAEVVGDRGVS